MIRLTLAALLLSTTAAMAVPQTYGEVDMNCKQVAMFAIAAKAYRIGYWPAHEPNQIKSIDRWIDIYGSQKSAGFREQAHWVADHVSHGTFIADLAEDCLDEERHTIGQNFVMQEAQQIDAMVSQYRAVMAGERWP